MVVVICVGVCYTRMATAALSKTSSSAVHGRAGALVVVLGPASIDVEMDLCGPGG